MTPVTALNNNQNQTREKEEGSQSATSFPCIDDECQRQQNVQKCAFRPTGLGSIYVGQPRRAEYDGVLIAKLGKRLLGQTFTTRVEKRRFGIGP
jgi:hypothetical protein